MWMMEERKRVDEARLEDRRIAEACAKLKEQAQKDQLLQAKQDLEHSRMQVQLDRELMQERAREAELRAAQRDEDRKQECLEAQQIRLEENRRFEANQAAAEKSRQVFETAMLTVLANMGRGGS